MKERLASFPGLAQNALPTNYKCCFRAMLVPTCIILIILHKNGNIYVVSVGIQNDRMYSDLLTS